MAGQTPDIRDKLVQTTQQKLQKAEPVRENQFIPDIPPAALDISLPPEVITSLSNEHNASKVYINKEYERLDESIDALKAANAEISAAQRRTQEIDDSIGLQFLGIFDSDYNYQHQRNRIKNAKQNLEMTAKELDLERQRDQLKLKESQLETSTYTKMLEFQTKKLNMTVAQSNAIIQSNAARKQMRQLMQNEYSHDEILNMQKTGNYDDVWTAQEVQGYLNNYENTQLDMNAKRLANGQNQIKLADQLETRALSNLPLQWGKSLLAQADKENQSLVQIPGSNTTVPVGKLRKAMADKLQTQQDAFKSIATNSIELAKNEGNVSAALSNVASVSSLWAENGEAVEQLRGMNILNITEDTAANVPIDSIHPSLRPDFQNLLQSVATLNDKQEQGQPVTTQDMFTLRQVVQDLNTKSEKVQTDLIEASEDKGTKAALKEWFANGKMQNQDNSSAMLVSNSLSMPNLGNDQALESSYQVLLENVASEIVDQDVDWGALDPEERTNLIFTQLLENDFRGKIANRDKILKAMNKKNHQGLTPVEAYVSNRSTEIMIHGINKLSEKYPEYTDYFKSLGRATNYQDIPRIAASLSELSFKLKQQNPDTPELLFNQELVDAMSEVIAESKNQWNSQLNPVRGSLMNLMFNTSPAKLVDDSLTTSFGSVSRNSWDELEKNTLTPQEQRVRRAIRSDVPFGDMGRFEEEKPQYSPVQLPPQFRQ